MPSQSQPAPLLEPPGRRAPAPRPYLPPMVARKRLAPAQRFAAAGVGLAVGAAVAYVTALWLQRSPLGGTPGAAAAPPPRRPPRATGGVAGGAARRPAGRPAGRRTGA